MQLLSYYRSVLLRGFTDGWDTLQRNLRWEIAVILAVGVIAAILGASTTTAVLVPLAGIGALCIVVLAGNTILAPVRMNQERITLENGLRARLKREQDWFAFRADLTAIYQFGKRLLVLMESERFSTGAARMAMESWRAGVSAFYSRQGQLGRAATWDNEFEVDAASRYTTGAKLIQGDLASYCHIVRFGLREIAKDVEDADMLD